jgi:hypothetical protein
VLGAIAVLAAVLTLPAPGAQRARPARRTLTPLETITLEAYTDNPQTTTTTFRAGTIYKFVFSGTETFSSSSCHYAFDAFYSFQGCGGAISPGKSPALLFNGVDPTNGLPYPPYGASHTYTLTTSKLSGKLTISTYAKQKPPCCPDASGSFTIEIFQVGEPTETVKFGVAQKGHQVLQRSAFELTSTVGVGNLVVPVPAPSEYKVHSTGARGTIRYHKVKFSAKGTLLLDEDKITLRVKRGTFSPGRVSRVVELDVVVTTTEDRERCPTGSIGTVLLTDNGGDKDYMSIKIPACKLHDTFQGAAHGGSGKLGFVNIVIDEVTPAPA